jgi:hypothetical protein
MSFVDVVVVGLVLAFVCVISLIVLLILGPHRVSRGGLMPNDLYVYTNPASAEVQLTLDNGSVIDGEPTSVNNRNDAHRLTLPAGTTRQGATLRITCDGYTPFSNRGIVLPADVGESTFLLDDVHLAEIAVAPTPPPSPAYPDDPADIIHAVYDDNDFDLATKEGCGEFTEACCTALHDHHSSHWGHIKKNPGQNQYNGHAVDAVMLLTGVDCGIYDIIHDSESPNASPAYNYKGPPDNALWYYDDDVEH